jgi:hypothetical protein
MALFIIGGLLPMLQQLKTLPTAVAVSSIFEMFFQFFLTGVVVTYVFLYEKPIIQELHSDHPLKKGLLHKIRRMRSILQSRDTRH